MQEKLRKTIFWFILIQPFLDIYWLNRPPLDSILPFSIPTILRIAGLFIIICLFLSSKQNWQRFKTQWWLWAYAVILILYCIAHLWSVGHFKTIDPGSYGYSARSELMYLFRMLLPLLLLYITQYAGLSQKLFSTAIKTVSGIFSVTIVVTNLFQVSLAAYQVGKLRLIRGNIFTWFTRNMPFSDLASKGIFNTANMLSAVLFMTLPLMLYFMYKKLNWLNILLVVCQSLAMIMLGTRVGTFGVLASYLVFAIAYFFHVFWQKDAVFSKGLIITLVLLGLGTSAIIPHSPVMHRGSQDTAIVKTRSRRGHQKRLSSELNAGLKKHSGKKERNFLKHFIRKHSEVYSIKPSFVRKSYSYKYDPYFWLHVMRMPSSERTNYRTMEVMMLNKVMANSGQPRDKWLGISYIRENNIYPLERDFLAQAYSLGIIGMVLYLGWYVYVLLYVIIAWFRAGRHRNFELTMLIIATGFILVTAAYSGNVLDYLTASLLIAFIEGYLLAAIKKAKSLKN